MTTKLNSFLQRMLATSETAAVNDELGETIPQDGLVDYLQMALARADTILDKRRQQVFFDVLMIPNKTVAQRVVQAYDVEYLMGLGLSIEATIDLTRELIATMKRMGVGYPATWDRLAEGILVGTEQEQVLERVPFRRKALD